MKWTNDLRIKLVPYKCYYIIHSLNKKSSESEWFQLILGKNQIKLEKSDSESKFLGVIFDKYLGFNNHVNALKCKSGARLNALKNICNKSWKLNPNTLLTIYKALLRSVLYHSCFILPLLTADKIKKIEAIQNSASR